MVQVTKDSGELLLDVYVINRKAYCGENMEMAVWIDKEGNLRYYYWLEISLPTFLEVLL